MKNAVKNEKPLVGIVIVNWNQCDYTIDCLNSLEGLKYKNWKAYVVDNASSDDSVNRLMKLTEKAEFIQSEVNKGWAGGNNIGITKAINDGCEFILLLNNDACVYEDTIDKLLEAKKNCTQEYGIFGCVIESYDLSGEIQFCGSFVNKKTGAPRSLSVEKFNEYEKYKYYESASAIGCAIFTESSTFNSVGLIDERYFLNYDETDWCFRANKVGIKTAIVPSARVRHKGSVSIGGARSPVNIYFMARNRLYFAQRHSSFYQRIYLIKQTIWDYDSLSKKEQGFGWILSLFIANSYKVKAFRRGIYDFIIGRSGNCPEYIVKNNKK